jgi:hypothetical protein
VTATLSKLAPIHPVPTFLTRDQLARRWTCSISTIKRLETAGELKPVRLGRRLVRYSMERIQAIENTGAEPDPASRSTTTTTHANTHSTTTH